MPRLSYIPYVKGLQLSLYFISIFLFQSCSSELTRDEFIRWVEYYQTGFHAKKNNRRFFLNVQHQPAQYPKLKNNVNTAVSVNEDGLGHSTLLITTHDPKSNLIDFEATDFSAHQKRCYFPYQFQSDTYVEQNKKKYPHTLFDFERQDNLPKAAAFVIAFESHTSNSIGTFVVTNSEHFDSLPTTRIKILKNDALALKDEQV